MEQVFEELNFPSAAVLKQVLKRRGIPFKNEEVDRLVKGETVRQVQAPTFKFDGKIASSDLNSRLFADLIDFTAAPSDGGQKTDLRPTKDNERYILVVQRVFDRKLWTRALTNKRSETVAEAFKEILQDIGTNPKKVTTDLGQEFDNKFKELLENEGIIVETKQKDDQNAIATIDRAIGSFKKALVRVAKKRRTDDWASLIAEVTEGQNNIPNSTYLEGNAPNDVEDDEDLRRKLRRKNHEFATLNNNRADKRGRMLEDMKRFRVMISKPRAFTRGFKPRFSDEVFNVARVEGQFVWDDKGNKYLTKFVQPIANNTETLPQRRLEQRSSALIDKKKQDLLREFANQVKDHIGTKRMTLADVGKFLVRIGGFRQKALEAKLNMTAPVKNFLQLFPDIFNIEIDGIGRSFVQLMRSPAFHGARRLRRTV